MSSLSDRAAVAACYQALLGRDPDEAGLEHYAAQLAAGMTREALEDIVRASDEYVDRQKRLNPASTRLPRDVQLCELANPAKWNNPEWLAMLKSLQAGPIDLVQPIDDRVWDRYEMEPVDLRVDRFQTPHMLLKHDAAIFTSVFVFLEKLQ